MASQLGNKPVGHAQHGHRHRGGPQEELQRGDAREGRQEGRKRFAPREDPTIRGYDVHRIEDLVPGGSEQSAGRLDRTDFHGIPQVDRINPSSEGRADSTIAVVEEEGRVAARVNPPVG